MANFFTLFAGFGMLFTGLRLVGSEMQILAGGRIRAIIAVSLQRRLAAQALGLLSGILTQSAGAVTFAAAGLVGARAATLRQALPLINWASVGTSALVLAASVNLRLVAFFLIGAAGFALLAGIDQRRLWRHVIFAVLGLALLLDGVDLLKAGIATLKEQSALVETLSYAGIHIPAGIALGVISGVALQSTQVATLLALPLAQSGLLSLEGVVGMIYGASLGTGIGRMIVASSMDLATRRLTLAGALGRAAGTTVLLATFAAEHVGGIPLVLAAVRATSSEVGMQTGLVYLVSQLVIALVSDWRGATVARWVEQVLPEPEESEPASVRPAFLVAGARSDAATAGALAAAEISRLVGFLPHYLNDLRDATERLPEALPLAERHRGSMAIVTAVDAFLTDARRESPEDEELIRLRIQLTTVRALHVELHAFASGVSSIAVADRPARLNALIEGLLAVLDVAITVLAAGAGPDEHDVLRRVTEDRGILMERVRAALVGCAKEPDAAALLDSTLHFEKCLWLLRRLPEA
ncbi:MAG: hypothetical protein WCQ89_06180 [Verrucomicrobiota bacterium]